jgi:hypothetical protein
MIAAALFVPRLIGLLAVFGLLAQGAGAQQYLGNSRQKCAGQVTVQTQRSALKVRQFEARSAELNDEKVTWQCQDEPPAEIQCPPNTNKVLVDRSQGGNTFSVVCLHQ